MDSKTFDSAQPVILQVGSEKKKYFPPSSSPGLFLHKQDIVIYLSLFIFWLQTHRELDGIADTERRGYGALHWTSETVSADTVVWWGARGENYRFSHSSPLS